MCLAASLPLLPDPLSEFRVRAEGIRVRDASQIRFAECWVSSNVGDGWSKARFRHKWEIEPHQQLRRRHELENGAELRLRGRCGQVVVEGRDSLPDLLRGEFKSSGPYAECVLKRLNSID